MIPPSQFAATLEEHEERLKDHETRLGLIEKSEAERDTVQGRILSELGTQTLMLEGSRDERNRRVGAEEERTKNRAEQEATLVRAKTEAIEKRTAIIQRAAVVAGIAAAMGGCLGVFRIVLSLFGH